LINDSNEASKLRPCILFDWGDTVMRVFPELEGPMASWPKVEAVPGVAAVLEVLGPRATLALATNAADSTEAEIREALDRCGLSEPFDRVFCFRGLGYRKPSPAFYRSILDQLALPPGAVAMVGDSLEGDVLAAVELGLAGVYFDPAGEGSPAGDRYRTIHAMDELPSALRELGLLV
jgi:putative hydrolase of the HAD superfamily